METRRLSKRERGTRTLDLSNLPRATTSCVVIAEFIVGKIDDTVEKDSDHHLPVGGS